MAQERAEDVVVVERPVHDAVLVLSSGDTENALVVVGEPHQIYTIVPVVVGVHFFASLQVVEADTHVIRTSNQVPPVMADVHRVHLSLLNWLLERATYEVLEH